MTANYRSSRPVVEFAQTLDSGDMIHRRLPQPGSVAILRGSDEKHDAQLILDEPERPFAEGREYV